MYVDIDKAGKIGNFIVDKRQFLRSLAGAAAFRVPSLRAAAGAAGLVGASEFLTTPAVAADTKLSAMSLVTGANQQYAIDASNNYGRVYTLGWVNVKDWGAVGNGSTSDHAAIVSAFNSISGNGTLYFPPGTYVDNTGLDFSGTTLHLTIMGAGPFSSIIKSTSGSMTGYVIDHGTGQSTQGFALYNIGITNTNIAAGGCLRLQNTGSGFTAVNCNIEGFIGFNIDGTSPTQILASNLIHSCTFTCTAGTAATAGSVGLAIGVHAAVHSCSIVNFDTGLLKWGLGGAITNCRTEVCTTGMKLGYDIAGTLFGTTAGVMSGCTFEGNIIGLYVGSVTDWVFEGCSFAFGSNGPPTGSASSTHGLYIGIAVASTFISCLASGAFTVAGFHVTDTLGAQSKLVFINCNSGGTFSVGATVKLSNLTQIACVNFISFATTFALLPGQASNAGEPPTQGERRLITDCNTSTYNAAAAGGAATTIFVTYNGSAWVVG